MIFEMKVGDEVFVVPNYGSDRSGFTAKIEKVARKWADIGRHGRFDIETGLLDGGRYSSRGVVYQSEAAWLAKKALTEAWLAFRRSVDLSFHRPAGVTIEAIEQARVLLFGVGR